jgi:replication factor C subunit 1
MEQIVARMMPIAIREKLKITKEELEQIIKSSNQDIRQTIYSLQLLASGASHEGVVQTKDVSVNIFEAARQILAPETDIKKKRDLFFTDYSLMPLFVQENYLNIRSSTLGYAIFIEYHNKLI